jgi:hypothetical protein
MRKLAFAGIFLLLAAGAALLRYSNFKRIERRPAGAPFSDTIIVDADTKSVAAAIVKTFNDGHRLGFSAPNKFPGRGKFHYFFLWNRKDSIFPDDIQLGFHVHQDPALRRYSELPADARSTDFYLYEPSGDYYWNSEYFSNGAPAKFRCAFIIHLEPLGSTKTKVEVLEYLPEIWVGKVFDPMGHSGPGFYYDIREVGPTAADRTELLEIIRHAVLDGSP